MREIGRKVHAAKFFNVSFGSLTNDVPLSLTANACSLVSGGFAGLISLRQRF